MTRRNLTFRTALIAGAVSLGSAAFAGRHIVIPVQPASMFADTEVSTNVALHSSRTDTRSLGLHIQLAGTPTNCLEVAFGRDANANGVLDLDEIETMYGWRGGRYFVENAMTWDRIETVAVTNALCGVCDFLVENSPSVAPRRFTATCGGESAFASVAANTPPPWLFRREWDTVRVVRRGAGVPTEWIVCDVEYPNFYLRLR